MTAAENDAQDHNAKIEQLRQQYYDNLLSQDQFAAQYRQLMPDLHPETFAMIIIPEIKKRKIGNKNTNFIRRTSHHRQELIDSLTKYINRIERPQKVDNGRSVVNYAFGFLFFKESQATNRHANHLLAEELRTRLQSSGESIKSIFRDVEEQRRNLARNVRNFKNDDRGINSGELNDIIHQAALWARFEGIDQTLASAGF
ncbi:hypothetical protein ACFORL_02365 [Legionella dresdenensis]|uniref:Uncharacterized protein n=1 Tax=Legionella dresdenensis TaxID=450200 RepID=A0ABV8CD26_9GAMM